jgi:hypothetical protein
MKKEDPNSDYVIGGWALGNILILIQILTEYSVVLYFFGFILYPFTLAYMIWYVEFIWGVIVATVSAMCWFFIAVQENEAYEGWETFFGVMTGVGGLLIIYSIWKSRKDIKTVVQSRLERVNPFRKSQNVQELKF